LYGPSFWYWPEPNGFEGLYGTLTGVTDSDVIAQVNGGSGCWE